MKHIALSLLLVVPAALFADGYPGRFTLHPEKYKAANTEVFAYYVSFPWNHAEAEIYVVEFRGAEITKAKKVDVGCSQHPPSKKEVNCSKVEEKTTDLSVETARSVIACFRNLDFSAPSDNKKKGEVVMIPDDIGIDVTILDGSGKREASFSFGDSQQIRMFNRRIEEIIRSPNPSLEPTH